MNRTFYERVLFEKVDEEIINESPLYGVDSSELIKIRILDWGTDRNGDPFNPAIYKKQDIAYIASSSQGKLVGENKWIIDRGHILLID